MRDDGYIGDEEYSEGEKQKLIDKYFADKQQSIKRGKLCMAFCVVAMLADTVVTGIFYALCGLHPLVFTFLSVPNTVGGQASYIPATVDTALPEQLFIMIIVLIVLSALKLTLSAVCGVCAVKKTAVKALFGISGCVFCFIDLIFSVIALTYPDSYSDPLLAAFLIVNIVFTAAIGVCVYLSLFSPKLTDYFDSVSTK